MTLVMMRTGSQRRTRPQVLLAAHRLLSYFSIAPDRRSFDVIAVDSKLADDGRKALFAEARRLTREERLQAFVRHSKLMIELYNAARRARSKPGRRP